MRLVLAGRSLNLTNHSWAGGSGNLSLEGPLLAWAAGGLGRTGHSAVAVCLGIILVLGCLNNLLVLLIFLKFESIRTPINLILLNISLSDLLVCIFGTPFSLAASVRGRWLLGDAGCKWYGFANALFGIVSLISLSILSYERYVTVLRRRMKVNVSSYQKSCLFIAGSWFYSLFWTLPPLFGWSSYGPEGPGTTCSVAWHSRSPNNISYIICLFIFCLILPLLTMIYCYGKIVKAIKMVSRFNMTTVQKRERHILFMVVSMVTCYLLCWMPYGIVSLIATFGKPGIITPTVSIVPSVLAKTSTFVNPVLCVLLNKQLEQELSLHEDYLFLRRIQKCRKPEGAGSSLLDCKEIINRFQDLLVKDPEVSKDDAKFEMQKVLQWQKTGYAPMSNLISYKGGKLKVEKEGLYYIYSQVSFCTKTAPGAPFTVFIYLNLPSESDRLLLKGQDTHSSSSVYCALQSTHLGGVFELRKGDVVFVNVTDSTQVNYDHGNTYFGMFKLY
ncbi:A-kinase anchor protein 17B-like [Platysternon megacephalum]|uniref:A-kinase anchor protein 17B-like n=1 Tax=Platysternon megacephalum TaxID=55544 RepID=A0A4D9EX47_9SAUR|nr:A-kinase anchor protein 17B-like [Platysternon megacephalum]